MLFGGKAIRRALFTLQPFETVQLLCFVAECGAGLRKIVRVDRLQYGWRSDDFQRGLGGVVTDHRIERRLMRPEACVEGFEERLHVGPRRVEWFWNQDNVAGGNVKSA